MQIDAASVGTKGEGAAATKKELLKNVCGTHVLNRWRLSGACPGMCRARGSRLVAVQDKGRQDPVQARRTYYMHGREVSKTSYSESTARSARCWPCDACKTPLRRRAFPELVFLLQTPRAPVVVLFVLFLLLF